MFYVILSLLPLLLYLYVKYLTYNNRSNVEGVSKVFQFFGYNTVLMRLTYETIWKPIFGFKYGPDMANELKFLPFKEHDSDILHFYSVDGASLQVANAELVKAVTSNRQKFTKPVEMYYIINFFGKNVVTVEGQDWKRHRKIVGPSFGESNNRVVFDVTLNQTIAMMNHWESVNEKTRDGIIIFSAKDMIKLTLHVISGAGFGKSMAWEDSEVVSNGHVMGYAESLEIVSNEILTKIVTPRWAYNFNAKLKRVDTAYKEFEKYIDELILQAQKNIKKGLDSSDLLTQLIKSSEAEGNSLSPSEISGNIFIFLLAGHETTAHTLAFVLALLAIHKNIQQKLYDIVLSVIGETGTPSYDDLNKLDYALAIFHETLRLYPIAHGVPKKAVEDVTVNIDGKDIFIKGGTSIFLNISAIHRNPRYWDNADEFNPERFMNKNKLVDHAFIPFSEGMRSCIGKRFAQIEGTLALALIIQKYEICLENREDIHHVLKAETLLTLTPDTKVRLLVKKRNKNEWV